MEGEGLIGWDWWGVGKDSVMASSNEARHSTPRIWLIVTLGKTLPPPQQTLSNNIKIVGCI